VEVCACDENIGESHVGFSNVLDCSPFLRISGGVRNNPRSVDADVSHLDLLGNLQRPELSMMSRFGLSDGLTCISERNSERFAFLSGL
jgi:hypothetical protein